MAYCNLQTFAILLRWIYFGTFYKECLGSCSRMKFYPVIHKTGVMVWCWGIAWYSSFFNLPLIWTPVSRCSCTQTPHNVTRPPPCFTGGTTRSVLALISHPPPGLIPNSNLSTRFYEAPTWHLTSHTVLGRGRQVTIVWFSQTQSREAKSQSSSAISK